MARSATVTTNHKWLQLTDEVVGIYNAWDVLATARGAKALEAEMADQGMDGYWRERYWPLVPAILDMQRRGLRANLEARDRYRRQVEDELAECNETILRAARSARHEIDNVGSDDQLAPFLFGTLGLKPARMTDSGKRPSLDQAALLTVYKNLRKKDAEAKPVVEALLHRSRLHTILVRYLSFQVDSDGRVRPRIKLGGAGTGRLAYADPALQQWPDEARHIFVAEPGCVLVGADYSQLEARINAYLTKDELDIEVFERVAPPDAHPHDPRYDIHSATACDLFGWEPDKWLEMDAAKRKAARNYAKTFRYGLLYGGDPEHMKLKTYCPCPKCEEKLPSTMSLPRLRVREASERYFQLHPRILEYRREIARQVNECHYLVNPHGRKRFFFAPWRECKRQAWNWCIQSTAAEIINDAMREGYQECGHPHFLQLHDFLGLEDSARRQDQLTESLRAKMEKPVKELGGVVFPVELKSGESWADL